MILYRMKVLFTIWAKVGTIRGRGRAQKSTEEHRTGRFAPDKN